MPTYSKNIERLKDGSYQDFRILYDAFAGLLYGFAFSLVKSESVSKDIVQEVFIRVWLNRKGLDINQSFKAYLFKISQNLIIDHFRFQMSNPLFEDYQDYYNSVTIDSSVEQHIDFDIFCRHLEKAKNKLTPRQREIFELNKEQGISASEIARHLGISEQTIYNQLSVALKILKQECKGLELLLFYIFFNC